MNVFKNENIKVSVKYEESRYGDNGEDGSGITIYYTIFNLSDIKMKFNISETSVFCNNSLRERDYYLTGYLLDEFELPSKTNRTGADIYLDTSVTFKVKDTFYLKLEDLTNAEEYVLFFEKVDSKNKNLKCISSEVIEKPILNPKVFEYKLQNSIERLDALEEKIGFTIENLSVKLDEYEIVVLGDFFMSDFEEYSDIKLNTTYYDNILSTQYCRIFFSDFLGYELFEIRKFFNNPADVEKIRLYPSISKR